MLQVSTVTIEPEITIDRTHVQFGEVAVNSLKTIVVRVRNAGKTAARLRAEGLNPIGPFSIVNALKPIAGGDSLALLIKFSPSFNRRSQEVLTLVGRMGSVDIQLSGHGVSPVVEVITPGSEKGLVEFGHIFVGESAKKELRVCNKSQFGLDFTVEPAPQTLLPSNLDGSLSFAVAPREARVEQEAEIAISVKFAADQEQLHSHLALYEVKVPNQPGAQRVNLRGHAWSTPLYAVLEQGEIARVDRIKNEFAFGTVDDAQVSYTLRGTLDGDGTATLHIGSCTATQGGTFELSDVNDRLLVDKLSSPVKAAGQEAVHISLKDPGLDRAGQYSLLCTLHWGSPGLQRRVRVLLRKGLSP